MIEEEEDDFQAEEENKLINEVRAFDPIPEPPSFSLQLHRSIRYGTRS